MARSAGGGGQVAIPKIRKARRRIARLIYTADPRSARTKNHHTATEEFAVPCTDTGTVSDFKGRD